MSARTERPTDAASTRLAPAGLSSFTPAADDRPESAPAAAVGVEAERGAAGGASTAVSAAASTMTLGGLPVGARLILRCRRDWRDACVVAADAARVVLSVSSPSGRTYRVRRPADSPLNFEGPLPILGEGQWRVGFARYDARW